MDMTDWLLGRAVLCVRYWSGELFHKSVGNLAAVCVGLALESDGLIWVLRSALSG